MAEFTKHPENAFCWVDISTTDVAGATRFYSRLLGWTVVDAGPGAGGYVLFMKNGKVAAGCGPVPSEYQPSAWQSYINTGDVDKCTQQLTEAGGAVVVEPFDVIDQGRMAVVSDPSGAVFNLWQPRAMFGAQVANDPGTWTWNELMTRDVEGSSQFYKTVFGWDAEQTPSPKPYYMFTEGERQIGGMLPMPDHMPPEVPPVWAVYLRVANLDQSLVSVKELGGQHHMGPMDSVAGRLAMVGDPYGATFYIIEPASSPALQ